MLFKTVDIYIVVPDSLHFSKFQVVFLPIKKLNIMLCLRVVGDMILAEHCFLSTDSNFG